MLLSILPWKWETTYKSTKAICQWMLIVARRHLGSPHLSDLLLIPACIPLICYAFPFLLWRQCRNTSQGQNQQQRCLMPLAFTSYFASQTIADIKRWREKNNKEKGLQLQMVMKFCSQEPNNLNPCQIKTFLLLICTASKTFLLLIYAASSPREAGRLGTCHSSNSQSPIRCTPAQQSWTFLGTGVTKTLSVNCAFKEHLQA